MGIVLVHQTGSDAVQPCHGVHGALAATWVPRGLVITKTSPTTAESGMMNSLGWQTVVATPPMVHNSLASGDSGVGLQGAVLETPHHQGYNDIPLLFSHLGRHGQQH